jgi:hypothetical protein
MEIKQKRYPRIDLLATSCLDLVRRKSCSPLVTQMAGSTFDALVQAGKYVEVNTPSGRNLIDYPTPFEDELLKSKIIVPVTTSDEANLPSEDISDSIDILSEFCRKRDDNFERLNGFAEDSVSDSIIRESWQKRIGEDRINEIREVLKLKLPTLKNDTRLLELWVWLTDTLNRRILYVNRAVDCNYIQPEFRQIGNTTDDSQISLDSFIPLGDIFVHWLKNRDDALSENELAEIIGELRYIYQNSGSELKLESPESDPLVTAYMLAEKAGQIDLVWPDFIRLYKAIFLQSLDLTEDDLKKVVDKAIKDHTLPKYLSGIGNIFTAPLKKVGRSIVSNKPIIIRAFHRWNMIALVGKKFWTK